MSNVVLNLVVVRSRDLEHSVAFYSCLGIQFTRHRHGTGPEHYSADLSGSVFELYPLTDHIPSTSDIRIGFRVQSVDAVIMALSDFPEAVVMSPRESEWGRRAILADPDGHKVELLQS
jgi:lactoylglutathione lyase